MTMKKRITSFALVLLMVLSSLAVLLPVMGVKAAAEGEKTYTKVTAEPAGKDWSGTYLIVYEKSDTEGYVFNGVDATNGYETATITDGKITIAATSTVTITKTNDGHSILVNGGTNDGKYMGQTSDANGMKFGSAMSNTISYNDSDSANTCVNIISGGAYLRYNATSGQNRFRYYKSSSYTNQQAIQLYKLDESACNHTPDTTVPAYTKETDTANHYFKCATCGEEYSAAHSSDTYHLTEDKLQHYQVCDVCNFEFDKGAHHVEKWTDTKDGENHTGVCEVCEKTVTDGHTVDTTVWKYDAESHWHECSECGAQLDKATHDTDSDCETCGRSVASGDVAATFEFGDKDTSKGHVDGNSASSYTETQGAYTLTLSSMSNVYTGAFDAKGNSCLKLGTSKKGGSFTFTVPDDVMSVVIYIAGYKANTVSISITGGDKDVTNQSVTTLSSNGEYTAITVDTKTGKTLTFTSTYRCMVNAIEFKAVGGSSCTHESFTYTHKDGDTHVAKCDNCGYEVEGTCDYTTTVGADGTNTFTCDKCGHVKTYTPAELVAAIEALGSGEYFVGDCILTGYVSDIRYPYTNSNKNPSFTIMVAGKEVYCYKATGTFVADFVLGDVVTLTGKMTNFKGDTVEFDQAEITDCKKTISSATLNIGTNIDVNYYVTIPDGVSYESYVMRFTFAGKTFDVAGVEDPKGLKFTFKDIGPHQMGLNISAELYGKTGETETKLSEKATYSVKENLESLLTSESETVRTLAQNMLIYGAAAQKYNGAADSDLVTDKTHSETETETLDLTKYAASVDNKNEFVNFVGMVLYFDSEPRLAIKYVLLNGATADDVTFEDLNGKLTHDGEYVYLTGVTADKFAEENMIANDLDGSTVTFTVNTYIYYILKGSTNENMKALATALYYYGVAAEEYVATQTNAQ